MSWQHLAELAVREQRLVEAEAWEELLEVQAERRQLIARLPSPAPLDALGILVTAREQARATAAALERAMAETGQQLDVLRRGRSAVRAYGGGERSGLDAHA